MTAPVHRTHLHLILLTSILVLTLLAPSRGQAQDKTPSSFPLVVAAPFPPDEAARVNASVRGLAGEKTSSSMATWESTPEWHDYQQSLNGKWGYLNRVRLNAMRSWGALELSGLHHQTRTVFYPFSGPDVLYADTLFPNSQYLVMAGLEPVGTMPDLGTLQQQGKLGPYLAQVNTSLATILAASFFKTKDMKNDFNNQLVDGLMPAIIVFLGRQGYTIDSITYVTLNRDGTLHKGGKSGVQITYYKDDSSNIRTVLYFQADLGNDGLKANPGYVRLMQRLGPGVTYLKAASYLLYEDYFSIIRNGILDNSVGVVEDDSGIPLRFFNTKEWDVTPYGNYTGPIPLFKEHYQPDLADYYARSVHEPLTFGSGYKFVANVSSLLVARKK